jgi:hypothetical protein
MRHALVGRMHSRTAPMIASSGHPALRAVYPLFVGIFLRRFQSDVFQVRAVHRL